MARIDAKTERIEIRTTPAVKSLLQRAAEESHRSVTDFLLGAGIEAAESALSDRRAFHLDDAAWQTFQDVLDRTETPAIRSRSCCWQGLRWTGPCKVGGWDRPF